MPALTMGPIRRWDCLGGMLAEPRAWTAAHVLPAEDTPKMVTPRLSMLTLA